MRDSIPYDARDIANFFLDSADARNMSLSITSLLKLVYFAHGWCLAEYNKPLIGQSFEAWQHGPVVRVLYDAFKVNSGSAISIRAKKFSAEQSGYILAHSDFSDNISSLLTSILLAYGNYHPFKLSDMTHTSSSPWTEIWDAGQKGQAPGMKIPNEKIREFFMQRNVGDTFFA